MTNDALDAVAGRLGARPPHYPLRVTARDLDTGRVRSVSTLVADEGDVGDPAGPSLLGLAGAAAGADVATTVLGGAPARQSGEMCVAITLRELKRPARFCQHYAVNATGPNPLAGTLGADVADAAAIIDGYEFGVLHPTSVEVGLRLRRGLRQAYLQHVTGPARARRGSTIALRLKLRRVGTGVRFTRTVRLRIPRGVHVGRHTNKLSGTDVDTGSDPSEEELVAIFQEGGGGATEQPPPDTVAGVRDQIEDLARYVGVTATIAGRQIRTYRDPALRISGDARVAVTVRR